MWSPSLVLVAAVSAGAAAPDDRAVAGMPSLVLPDLQCLGKDGRPLPEATFGEIGDSSEVTRPVGIDRPMGRLGLR